ncbi:arylacetamide deacetylase-like 4 [Tiliqua scincoides]|uniref:arylacetamide deacetylase-like 4 n=1 Tax=Tiliqua scincoides TaxID=71010 RepID=UPI0034622053
MEQGDYERGEDDELNGVDPNRIVIGGDSTGGTYAAAVAHELVSQVDLPRLRAQILIDSFLQALDFNLPSYQLYHSSPIAGHPCPIISKKVVIWLGFRTKKVRGVDAMMKNAHVPEAMRVNYNKWISANLIPAEFKLKCSGPLVLALFSEQLYEVCKPALETKFSPLLADDEVIRQLPETFIMTCKYTVFRDDGLLYKKRLEDNGVPVTWHNLQDSFHGNFYLVDYPLIEFQCTGDAVKQVIHFLEGL